MIKSIKDLAHDELNVIGVIDRDCIDDADYEDIMREINGTRVIIRAYIQSQNIKNLGYDSLQRYKECIGTVVECVWVSNETYIHKYLAIEKEIILSRIMIINHSGKIDISEWINIDRLLHTVNEFKYYTPIVAKISIKDGGSDKGLIARDTNTREYAIAYLDGKYSRQETHLDCIDDMTKLDTEIIDSLGRDGFIESSSDKAVMFFAYRINKDKHYWTELYKRDGSYKIDIYTPINTDMVVVIEESINNIDEIDIIKIIHQQEEGCKVVIS